MFQPVHRVFRVVFKGQDPVLGSILSFAYGQGFEVSVCG